MKIITFLMALGFMALAGTALANSSVKNDYKKQYPMQPRYEYIVEDIGYMGETKRWFGFGMGPLTGYQSDDNEYKLKFNGVASDLLGGKGPDWAKKLYIEGETSKDKKYGMIASEINMRDGIDFFGGFYKEENGSVEFLPGAIFYWGKNHTFVMYRPIIMDEDFTERSMITVKNRIREDEKVTIDVDLYHMTRKDLDKETMYNTGVSMAFGLKAIAFRITEMPWWNGTKDRYSATELVLTLDL